MVMLPPDPIGSGAATGSARFSELKTRYLVAQSRIQELERQIREQMRTFLTTPQGQTVLQVVGGTPDQAAESSLAQVDFLEQVGAGSVPGTIRALYSQRAAELQNLTALKTGMIA